MKTKSFTSHLFWGGIFAAGLALLPASFAQDATNAAADTASNTVAQTAAAGGQNGHVPNVPGLPPETLNRLSPELTTTLMQQRQGGHSESSNFGASIDAILALLVPFAAFALVFGIVALGVGQKLKRNKMLHETLRMMIEKGQPIPPELLQPQERARRPRSDLRSGLVFIAVGIGVVIMGLFLQNKTLCAAGSIPMLMGVAFLIAWKIESKKNGGQPK